jgi:hypothetical protein
MVQRHVSGRVAVVVAEPTGAIVNCCVMKMFLSGEFLQNSVLEGTSFDDERHLFVAA